MKKRPRHSKTIFMGLFFYFAVLWICPLAFSNGIQIITSKGTPVENIDAQTIKNIFMGKKKSWPDGSPVEFVTLDSGEAHELFLKTYVKKTPSQFKTYWKKQVFTGKGKNPKSFDSESEVATYVAGKKGALGYVSEQPDTSDIKILTK